MSERRCAEQEIESGDQPCPAVEVCPWLRSPVGHTIGEADDLGGSPRSIEEGDASTPLGRGRGSLDALEGLSDGDDSDGEMAVPGKELPKLRTA